MYIRRLIVAAVAVLALASCSSNKADEPLVEPGKREQPVPRLTEPEKMMNYIESPARNKELDDAFAKFAPAVVANIFSGALGSPITKLNKDKKPLKENYTGPGSIHVDDKKTGWKADADIFWRNGGVDYSMGITSIHLDAGSQVGGMHLAPSGVGGKTSPAITAFKKAGSGPLLIINDSGRAKSDKFTSYVNAEKEAIELDNKVLYVLGYNTRLFPGGE